MFPPLTIRARNEKLGKRVGNGDGSRQSIPGSWWRKLFRRWCAIRKLGWQSDENWAMDRSPNTYNKFMTKSAHAWKSPFPHKYNLTKIRPTTHLFPF